MTPIKKMGFSQRASCKAQGLIARSSKKNFIFYQFVFL